MIERVATEICRREAPFHETGSECKACREAHYNNGEYLPSVPDGCKGLAYVYLARIAIEAMREPTASMIDAADIGDDEFNITNSAAHARECWKSMIDEALIELGPHRPPGSADLYGVPRAEE